MKISQLIRLLPLFWMMIFIGLPVDAIVTPIAAAETQQQRQRDKEKAKREKEKQRKQKARARAKAKRAREKARKQKAKQRAQAKAQKAKNATSTASKDAPMDMRTLPNEHFDKGSYLTFAFGTGVSQLNYQIGGDLAYMQQLTGKNNIFFPSFTAQLGYTYYFLPWMGISTGVHFTTYGSMAQLDGQMNFNNAVDDLGTAYQHRTSFSNWREQQQLYLIEVPLQLQFKYKPDKIGMYASVGAKLGLPVYSSYRQTSGVLYHSAYYSQWDLLLENLSGHFDASPYRENRTGKLTGIQTLNAVGIAELGMLFQVHPRVDLSLGFYGQYVFNDLSTLPADQRPDLGFRDVTGYDFMQPYQGVMATNTVSSIHPWEAGVKLGLNIYVGKNKAQRRRQLERLSREFPSLMPRDTLRQKVHDTVYIYLRDTLVETASAVPPMIEEPLVSDNAPAKDTAQTITDQPKSVEKMLDELLGSSVIWFKLDKYDPILEPDYILDSIADVLLDHPELRVAINGHACVLGNDQYNQRLARKRADAVANMLIKKGVDRDQLDVASFGASHPYHYNGKHQLAKDRRVEIIPGGNSQQSQAVGEAMASKRRDVNYSKYKRFLGEETITPGYSLAQLARDHFGVTQYWVFIYEANADKIANPNELPVGLHVMIPDLIETFPRMTREQLTEEAFRLEKKYKRPRKQ